jgi:uncharacterized membrane protein YkvA (DUF1232 family)
MRIPFVTRRHSGERLGLLRLILRLPAYVRLVFGMLRDGRVSTLDRMLAMASIAYLFMPFDLVTDAIPVLGQVDDLFLMVGALGRMFDRADRRVVLSHWTRPPAELDVGALQTMFYLASLFATPGRRRRLRTPVRHRERGPA